MSQPCYNNYTKIIIIKLKVVKYYHKYFLLKVSVPEGVNLTDHLLNDSLLSENN